MIAPAPRTILDVSSIARWTGTPDGILRVEHALAAYARASRADIVLAIYDPVATAFRELSPEWAATIIGWNGAIDRVSFDLRRHWNFLRQWRSPRHPLLMALERRRITAPFSGLRNIVGLLQRLLYLGRPLPPPLVDRQGRRRTIVPIALALGEKLILGPGDTVIAVGYDWGNQDSRRIEAEKRRTGFRYVAMCHDIMALQFPEFLPDHAVAAFRRYWNVMFALADRILVNSRHVESDIRHHCRRTGIEPAEICVVAPGYDPPRFPTLDSLPQSLEPGQFLLFVGTIEPRKGHDLLLRVWERLLTAGVPQRHRFRLVLVGRPGWKTEALVRRIRNRADDASHLLHLENIDDTALSALYAAAAFCVLPSRYEGFGLPVIESFAHGKAVIASSGGALPEIVNGLSPCLDPRDEEAWFAALRGWIEDPALRAPYEAMIRDNFVWPNWYEAATRIVDMAGKQPVEDSPVSEINSPSRAPPQRRIREAAVPPRRLHGLVCAGVYGSASTWMFNLVAGILKTAGETSLRTIYADEAGDAVRQAFRGESFILAKSHMPTSSVRLLIDECGLPVILTLREPRDAVASMMLRWNLDFELALARVRKSAEAIARLADGRPVLAFRYEDEFTSKSGCADAVAQWLGVALPAAERDALLAELTPQAINARIEIWRKMGVLGNARPDLEYEPETHWHVGHIGDRQSGKWPRALTAIQAAQVLHATRSFCETFGYPADFPADRFQ